MSKNVCFAVPDGVGIRNYLFTKLFKQVSDSGNVFLLHKLTPQAIEEVKSLHGVSVSSEEYPEYKETTKEKFLREVAVYARLWTNKRLKRNETILTNWIRKEKRLSLKVFYRLVEVTGYCVSFNYSLIMLAERMHLRAVRNSQYFLAFRDYLVKNEISTVFCTHQRAVIAIPLVEAAKELSVRAVTVIYSWDNLPKARLAVRADQYLVWSEYMAGEMKDYYPEIPEENVLVTGTPQFEFYQDPDLIDDRDVFCSKYGLDPEKQIICFSGDDEVTSPYDAGYLEDVVNAVSISEISNKVQVLFRRCPTDLSDRYDYVLKGNSEFVFDVRPDWSFTQGEKNWALVYPKIEDVKLLVNVCYHCDVVINIGSTMAHDFSIFNKPALYLKYDQPNSVNWSTTTVYDFQHFRSIGDLNAVGFVNSKEELGGLLELALKHPERVAEDRKKWFEKIVSVPLEMASIKISELLLS